MEGHEQQAVEDRLRHKNLKVKIPHFAGSKGQNIKRFFSKFEKVVAYYEIEENKILNLLGLHLERNALLYFDRLIEEQDGVLNYDIIKQNLLQRYDEQELKFVARARLHKRKQTKDERITHFYNDVLTKGHEISLNDDELLFIFLNGLKDETRLHVVCLEPQNIKEAFQKAKRYEDLKTWESQTPNTSPRNDYRGPSHQKSIPHKRHRFDSGQESPSQKQRFYEEKISTESNALKAIPKTYTKKKCISRQDNNKHPYKRRDYKQNVSCDAITAVLKTHINNGQTASNNQGNNSGPKVKFYVGKAKVDSGQTENINDYKQINTCESSQNKGQSNGFQKPKTPNKNGPSYKISKTVTKRTGVQKERQGTIVTRGTRFTSNSSWKNQAAFTKHQTLDTSNKSYESKIEHRNKTLKEITLYFKTKEDSSKQNVQSNPKTLGTEKQENKLTDLKNEKLISNLHNKENEEQFLRNMVKKSANEIHRLEAQLTSQNDYFHTLMRKYDEINKKCELVIKNSADLAENIRTEKDTTAEKLYSKNIKLTAENYYLTKQIENNANTKTNLKIKVKNSAKVYFPPMCQRIAQRIH